LWIVTSRPLALASLAPAAIVGAIGNAVSAAIGKRLRKLPVSGRVISG
jgi:CO/xanthine dehydrogenase Mo-binding subunit